jgi:hypothetical protein
LPDYLTPDKLINDEDSGYDASLKSSMRKRKGEEQTKTCEANKKHKMRLTHNKVTSPLAESSSSLTTSEVLQANIHRTVGDNVNVSVDSEATSMSEGDPSLAISSNINGSVSPSQCDDDVNTGSELKHQIRMSTEATIAMNKQMNEISMPQETNNNVNASSSATDRNENQNRSENGRSTIVIETDADFSNPARTERSECPEGENQRSTSKAHEAIHQISTSIAQATNTPMNEINMSQHTDQSSLSTKWSEYPGGKNRRSTSTAQEPNVNVDSSADGAVQDVSVGHRNKLFNSALLIAALVAAFFYVWNHQRGTGVNEMQLSLALDHQTPQKIVGPCDQECRETGAIKHENAFIVAKRKNTRRQANRQDESTRSISQRKTMLDERKDGSHLNVDSKRTSDDELPEGNDDRIFYVIRDSFTSTDRYEEQHRSTNAESITTHAGANMNSTDKDDLYVIGDLQSKMYDVRHMCEEVHTLMKLPASNNMEMNMEEIAEHVNEAIGRLEGDHLVEIESKFRLLQHEDKLYSELQRICEEFNMLKAKS